MISTREQLLAESKGVMDSAKWLKKRIKTRKKRLDNLPWSPYDEVRCVEVNVIEEMNEIRVGLEKHARKLKHMADEEL